MPIDSPSPDDPTSALVVAVACSGWQGRPVVAGRSQACAIGRAALDAERPADSALASVDGSGLPGPLPASINHARGTGFVATLSAHAGTNGISSTLRSKGVARAALGLRITQRPCTERLVESPRPRVSGGADGFGRKAGHPRAAPALALDSDDVRTDLAVDRARTEPPRDRR